MAIQNCNNLPSSCETQIGTNCVYWGGEDISCGTFSIKNGDSITEMMNYLLTKYCELIDVSALTSTCLTLPENPTIIDFLVALEEKFCEERSFPFNFSCLKINDCSASIDVIYSLVQNADGTYNLNWNILGANYTILTSKTIVINNASGAILNNSSISNSTIAIPNFPITLTVGAEIQDNTGVYNMSGEVVINKPGGAYSASLTLNCQRATTVTSNLTHSQAIQVLIDEVCKLNGTTTLQAATTYPSGVTIEQAILALDTSVANLNTQLDISAYADSLSCLGITGTNFSEVFIALLDHLCVSYTKCNSVIVKGATITEAFQDLQDQICTLEDTIVKLETIVTNCCSVTLSACPVVTEMQVHNNYIEQQDTWYVIFTMANDILTFNPIAPTTFYDDGNGLTGPRIGLGNPKAMEWKQYYNDFPAQIQITTINGQVTITIPTPSLSPTNPITLNDITVECNG